MFDEKNLNKEIYLQRYWEILQEAFSYKISKKENEYLIDILINNEVVATQKIIPYSKDEMITIVSTFSECKRVEVNENSITIEVPIGTSTHRVIENILIEYKLVKTSLS